MLESILICTVAWLLLAGATARFRPRTGLRSLRAIRLTRLASLALFTIAAITSRAPLPGEWLVRLLGAMSIAAALLTLGLSAFPDLLLRPVSLLARLSNSPHWRR